MASSPGPTGAGSAQDPSQLLEHLDWVRSLARRLTRDESSADDLVQRTFLSALRWPRKSHSAPPRAWLHRVLQSEAQRTWRSDSRRRDRESVAVAEAPLETPDPADVQDRFELHRGLFDAVDELDELYRTVILLRYFEGLTPTKIAGQLEVPVNTITSRLMRARDLLRRRLDGNHGSRAAWTAIALRLPGADPLTAAGGAAAQTTGTIGHTSRLAASFSYANLAFLTSSLAMKSLFALATAAILLLFVQTSLKSTPIDTLDGLSPATKEVQSNPTLTVPGEESRGEVFARTEASGATLLPTTEASEQPEPARWFSGLVVDAAGNPCAGIRLRPSAAPQTGLLDDFVVSDGNGAISFQINIAEHGRGFRWVCDSPDWVTLITTSVDSTFIDQGSSAFIAVTPTQTQSGIVVDWAGQPVQGAAVTLSLPEGFRARYDALLANTIARTWRTTTDAAGHFQFRNAPAAARVAVAASAEGFRSSAPADCDEARDAEGLLRVVLQGLDPDRWVTGVVLDRTGQPIEAASIALGRVTQETDSQGTFRFHLDRFGPYRWSPTSLTVAKRGRASVTHTPPMDAAGSLDWSIFVEVRMPDAALDITGRVLSTDGLPVPGAKVWVTDVTVLGSDAEGEVQIAESLSSGAKELWHTVTADASGHFRIDGLNDRIYHLRALIPGTVQMTPLTPIAAGQSGAEIRFTREEALSPLRGRVVGSTGQPLAGVKVEVTRESFRATASRITRTDRAKMRAVFTGDDGVFEFPSVPLDESVVVVAAHPGYTTRWTSRTQLDFDSDGAVITLSRFAHVRLRLADDAQEVTRVSFLDNKGEPVLFHHHIDGSRYHQRHADVIEGMTPTLVVPDTAVAVEYRSGDGRMRTVPIVLDFDAPTVLMR